MAALAPSSAIATIPPAPVVAQSSKEYLRHHQLIDLPGFLSYSALI